jgi:hypothetical protein
MLRAEFSDEAATDCYEAALRILDHVGIDQDPGRSSDFRAYREGDLEIARTNTGHVEVRYKDEVGLRVSPHGAGEQAIWRPGDWVHEVNRIDQRIPTH